jgi:hypothetical protein
VEPLIAVPAILFLDQFKLSAEFLSPGHD